VPDPLGSKIPTIPKVDRRFQSARYRPIRDKVQGDSDHRWFVPGQNCAGTQCNQYDDGSWLFAGRRFCSRLLEGRNNSTGRAKLHAGRAARWAGAGEKFWFRSNKKDFWMVVEVRPVT